MRTFLTMLAVIFAAFSFSQTASAQTCSGFAMLKPGQEYWDAGGGRAIIGNKCYQRALCVGGTIMNKGGDKRVCMAKVDGPGNPPTNNCQALVRLGNGDRLWKRGDMWKTQRGQCYLRAECPGGTLRHLGGDTHECQVQGPVCGGTLQLGANGMVWKKADNMWRPRSGNKCYTNVQCAPNTTLKFKSGDTYYCQPNPVECTGNHRGGLPAGAQLVGREHSGMAINVGPAWVFYGVQGCFNKKDVNGPFKCDNATFGDPLRGTMKACYAVVKAPECEGVGRLATGAEIWKRAENMWKTKDGKHTYCSVQCQPGSTLTHKSGDTHYCKPNAPTCEGLGRLAPNQEIWRRAEDMWKTKDGKHTYCMVRCTGNSTLTHKSGDTHYCKPNAPLCQGTLNLPKNGEAWRQGANMWKAKDGEGVYCNVRCEAGSTLTHKSGDTHYCKPNPPVCVGHGKLVPNQEIWKRASNMWKTKDGKNTYCSVECTQGSTLVHRSGDTHYCKPPVCLGHGNLAPNQEIWKRASNMWKTKDGKNTYCSVSCPAGTTLTHKSGDTHYCKPNPPVCVGHGKLVPNQEIWKRASNMWKTKDGKHTYCSVECTQGSTLVHKSGDTHYCKPPVCLGHGNLAPNQEIWKRASNMWKTKDGKNTYCSVSCPEGTTLTHKSGDTHYCKPNPPVCDGHGKLKSGQEIWKRAANMWKTKDGKFTYCSVECPAGTTLTHKSGDTHYCKPNPPVCVGHGKLVPNQEIWKRASNMWKTKDGKHTYCSVECTQGSTLVHRSGDTHYCKPAVCQGHGNLKSGQEIWKRASNMWKTKDGKNTYCSVSCPEGTKLTHKSGDTHYCKPNPPVCVGHGKLKSGQEIWKRASNMWKTKDGKHTYCSVECPAGTKLTHKSGDTHYCKPNPPVCVGHGKLKSGQEIWKRASNMWKTKDGKHTYCSVECPAGTKLTHKSGDTHYCKPNPPVCVGHGKLKSGQEIWKRASNMWKTKDGKHTYCSVECPAGTKLTHKSGDTHYCKPNPPVCVGHGKLKSGQEIWKRASNMWKTKDGKHTYCSVECPAGTKLTHKSGDTHYCKPTLTCQQISNKYGTSHYNGWGKAPESIRDIWRAQRCTTCKPGDKKGNDGRCYTPPTCSGTGKLKPGTEIWKKSNTMWKTKDGKHTYCNVQCLDGSKLTHKSGDTHYCKPAANCQGHGNLKSGQEIWKRASNMWKTKDGKNTYCSVSCPSGTKLTHKSGDTHYCKPTANCQGHGNLKSGQEIWKRASNMWKTKDGKNTYCSVSCPSGTKLTHKSGDTHYCKPTHTCKGQFKSLPGGVKKIANENQVVNTNKAAWVFYGANNCFNKRDFGKGKIACNNNTFGDPLYGVVKGCYAMYK